MKNLKKQKRIHVYGGPLDGDVLEILEDAPIATSWKVPSFQGSDADACYLRVWLSHKKRFVYRFVGWKPCEG